MKAQLAERQESLPAESPTVSMFERLARDPQVDVEKIERLMQMQERAQARIAEQDFNAALAEMQADLPTIGERGGIKNSSGKVQSTYALWEDVNLAILPVLKRHGFSLTFRQENRDNGICVTGVLAHRGGHSERTSITLPLDTSGSKNNVQAVGSSVSYGKRYTAGMLLNLTSHGEDDDGQGAGVARVSEDQVANLEALLTEVGGNKAEFLKYIKAESLQSIPALSYEGCVKLIEAKRKKERK